MSTITATDYANVKRELAETEELLHVAEAENSELRARVAALEVALAAKDAPKLATECCGYSREQVAEKMAMILDATWEPKKVRGIWFGPQKCHLLEALDRTVEELKEDGASAAAAQDLDSGNDSDWDCCSCMTPECCYDQCQTSEDYKEWFAEETTKGVEHRFPVRDFKKVLKDGWGLERELARAEERLRYAESNYRGALMSDPKDYGYSRMCSNMEDAVETAKSQVEWLKKELAKFPVTKVIATVPVNPGTLTCVITPERALKLAVMTRHMGLGISLRRDTMRVATRMELGEAERLIMTKRLEAV